MKVKVKRVLIAIVVVLFVLVVAYYSFTSWLKGSTNRLNLLYVDGQILSTANVFSGMPFPEDKMDEIFEFVGTVEHQVCVLPSKNGEAFNLPEGAVVLLMKEEVWSTYQMGSDYYCWDPINDVCRAMTCNPNRTEEVYVRLITMFHLAQLLPT